MGKTNQNVMHNRNTKHEQIQKKAKRKTWQQTLKKCLKQRLI